jgi:hypothetical protein
MEQPAFHLPLPCEQTSVIANRLENLADEARSLIQTIRQGRLRFASDEYIALEAASLNLAEIAKSVSGEVQALGKRREQTVFEEGQKLLSIADSTKAKLMTSQKLKSRLTLVRNLRLFFTPPNESTLDSLKVKAREKIIN